MKLYSLYVVPENHTLFSGAYPYGQNKGMPPFHPTEGRSQEPKFSWAKPYLSLTWLRGFLTWIKYLHSRHVKTTVFIDLSFSEGRKVIVKEVVEPNDTKATETSQLYRNPTFLGVLIGVCALIVIVIVCLLLVAFRAGHLNADKIQGTVLVQNPLVSFKKRRALSMCQNWPVRPLPDRSVW